MQKHGDPAVRFHCSSLKLKLSLSKLLHQAPAERCWVLGQGGGRLSPGDAIYSELVSVTREAHLHRLARGQRITRITGLNRFTHHVISARLTKSDRPQENRYITHKPVQTISTVTFPQSKDVFQETPPFFILRMQWTTRWSVIVYGGKVLYQFTLDHRVRHLILMVPQGALEPPSTPAAHHLTPVIGDLSIVHGVRQDRSKPPAKIELPASGLLDSPPLEYHHLGAHRVHSILVVDGQVDGRGHVETHEDEGISSDVLIEEIRALPPTRFLARVIRHSLFLD